jgi:outer membrane biosynthesis protein TonB
MKRCPNCEFIYEDDQSHCDMDGTRLAHDSRPLPKLQAFSVVPESDSKWRSRAVPVFASALLAIVLGLVYFVSLRQVEPTANAGSESTTVETPATEPVAPVPAVPEPTSPASEAAPQTEASPTTNEPDTAIATPAPEVKKPGEVRTEKQNVGRSSKPPQMKNQKNAGSKEASEKDDSKVRSILKKTGRFFKKTLPL